MKTMRNSRSIVRKIFAFVVLVTVLNFILGCGLYYFEKDPQPEVFGTVRSALEYTVLLFTTIGYLDIYPLTIEGKIICSVTATVGSLVGIICIFGIIYGFIRFGSFLRYLRMSNLNR